MKQSNQRVSILNKNEGGNRRGVFCLLFSPGRKKVRPSRRGDRKRKIFEFENTRILVYNHQSDLSYNYLPCENNYRDIMRIRKYSEGFSV
jgi:hypothetical protein